MRSANLSIRALVVLIAAAMSLIAWDKTSASDTPPNPGRDIAIALQAAEIAEGIASRDRWDAAFVVKRVGKDPAKLFAWVQANSSWIPYRGVLRGPVGVLMDGRGNSLDRSLLLADLLKRAGQTVRLAHGQMTQQDAAARLSQLVAREGVTSSPAGDARLNINGAAMLNAATAQLSAQKQDAARALATLNSRVTTQSRRLLQMIEKPDAGDEWSNRFVSALEALQDHWWVQRQTPAGWVDMDVLTQNGKAPVPVQTTSRPEDLAMDGLYHEVTVRVIAEQWTAGSLAEHVAMEHTLRPADLIGKAIALQFWPTAPIKAQTPAGRDELKNAKGNEWAAILTIDRDAADAGILPESGDDLDQPPQGGAFGGIAGGFNSTFARPTQHMAPKSTLSAVWLEYEFKSPGQEPRKVRREIFDLVGPARRAEGAPQQLALDDTARTVRERAMTMRNEILPVPCAIAPTFVTHLVSQSLLGNRQILTAATQPNVTDAAVFEMTQHAAPPITPLYALALAATSIDSTSTYVDKPLLFTNHFYPKPGDENLIVNATDIVANDIGVSLAVDDAFATRLTEGVRHTNAESLFHGPMPGYSTADAFAQPGAWVALTASDETAINALTLPADARRRILDEVMNGEIIVAPRVALSTPNGPYAGWWRIDPATGATLGFGANGWGSATTERSFLSRMAGAAGRAFIKNYAKIALVFAVGYGFCLLPRISYDRGWGRESDTEKPPRLGLKVVIKDSAKPCLAEGGFYAALVTMPLVAEQVNVAAEAPRVPPPEPVPPVEPPCPGGGGGSTGTKVMPGRPGSGNTQPMPTRVGTTGEGAGQTSPTRASPPAGSRPPGPYQMNRDFKQWHAEHHPQEYDAAVAVGTPETLEYADQAARSAYNDAISKGLPEPDAFQMSKDRFYEAWGQSPRVGWEAQGTVEILGSPARPGPAQAAPASPSSLETADTQLAPARVPPSQPTTQPMQTPTPGQSPKASTGAVPRQSPNASSGPIAQRPPLQQRAPGSEVEPISPEGQAPSSSSRPAPAAGPRPVPSVSEASARLARAKAAKEAAELELNNARNEAVQATQDYVRMRGNKPNPGRDWEGDQANFDEAASERLLQKSIEKRNKWFDAAQKFKPLDEEFIEAANDLASAEFRQRMQELCGGP